MFVSDVTTSYVCCHTRHCHITTLKDIYKYLDSIFFYQFTTSYENPIIFFHQAISWYFTNSSSLLVPPRLLTITASLSPEEERLSAVAEEGLVMWVRIAFTASLWKNMLIHLFWQVWLIIMVMKKNNHDNAIDEQLKKYLALERGMLATPASPWTPSPSSMASAATVKSGPWKSLWYE